MDNASVNICAYGYAAAVIGIVAALITVFSACLPALAAVLVNAFSFLWWLGFAITVTGGTLPTAGVRCPLPGLPHSCPPLGLPIAPRMTLPCSLIHLPTLPVYNNDVANDTSVLFPDGYPRGYYRNIVIALSWTACACAALSVPLALKGGKAEAAEDGKQGSHKGEQFVADPPPPAAVV